MAEYIEREAFKQKYLCCGYLPEMSEKEFDEFPAADVVPVVHGRKIEDGDIGCFWLCPLCGECLPYGANYCPNCGAKIIDGGADGEFKDE